MTTATTTTNLSNHKLLIHCFINPKTFKKLHFPHKKPRNFAIFAAKDDNKFRNWDKMELKFGKLVGQNPNLTLAKVQFFFFCYPFYNYL